MLFILLDSERIKSPESLHFEGSLISGYSGTRYLLSGGQGSIEFVNSWPGVKPSYYINERNADHHDLFQLHGSQMPGLH